MLKRLSLVLVVVLASSAPADDFVDRANAQYKRIQPGRRSDEVLIPLLAAMAPPPAGVDEVVSAMLRPPTGPIWAAAEAWAAAEPQQALIDALDLVTTEEDYRVAFAFGQPYGADDVSVATIRSGLYTELGDPPLLAAAQFLYLPSLDDLACLVHVEATRLQADGDPVAAASLMTNWLFFARQIADRAFTIEAAWGYEQMAIALMRVRDIVWEDDKGPRLINPNDMVDYVERLDSRRGYLGFDRLIPPQGDRIAAEQLIERVLSRGGGVKVGTFAPTMARLSSVDRPLRLFGEASAWESAARTHSDYSSTRNAVKQVYGDWEARWKADPFSSIFNRDPESKAVFADPNLAVVGAALERGGRSLDDLFSERTRVLAELIGTGHALAIVAYARNFGGFPPQIESIRPRWIKEIKADPYNPMRARGRIPPFEYFVPERDTKGVKHEMLIVTPNVPQFPTFSKPLFRDDFVLYSRGADNAKNWAKEIENTTTAPRGRDYLIWPPISALAREYLVQQGALE